MDPSKAMIRALNEEQRLLDQRTKVLNREQQRLNKVKAIFSVGAATPATPKTISKARQPKTRQPRNTSWPKAAQIRVMVRGYLNDHENGLTKINIIKLIFSDSKVPMGAPSQPHGLATRVYSALASLNKTGYIRKGGTTGSEVVMSSKGRTEKRWA
jgi:hypothetical protein